jgi:hypothetical protein
MAASNPVNFLRDLGSASDDRALALKMFWGRVLEAFRAKTLLWDNTGNVIASKVVDAGKSWQFPIIGDDPSPEYHSPGEEMLGMAVDLSEGTITIDDILVSHYDVSLANLQLSHFDVLAPFATKLGRSLAIDFDKKLFRIGVLAARTAAVNGANTGIHSGGNRVVADINADMTLAYPATADGANAFVADVAELGQLMDEDNVPEDGRWLFIPPYIRRILSLATNVFNKDYSNNANDLMKRSIGILHGFAVMQTNHLPNDDFTGSSDPTKYNDDFTYDGASEGRPCALALCGAQEGSAAIGFVQAGGIMPHMHDDERRNTKFMKAQMMVGAGILAPWCAGEIYCTD